MQIPWNAFWFIIGVSLLVTIHEFGHFWVARKLGFKVLRFSVGFGKPLYKKIGAAPDHIEYVIAAIPLGGYVRMLDERRRGRSGRCAARIRQQTAVAALWCWPVRQHRLQALCSGHVQSQRHHLRRGLSRQRGRRLVTDHAGLSRAMSARYQWQPVLDQFDAACCCLRGGDVAKRACVRDRWCRSHRDARGFRSRNTLQLTGKDRLNEG
jgi:hypothetical protein